MINLTPFIFKNPYAAYVETRRLESFINDTDFTAVYALSTFKVLPYQIAAARFTLRSYHLKD